MDFVNALKILAEPRLARPPPRPSSPGNLVDLTTKVHKCDSRLLTTKRVNQHIFSLGRTSNTTLRNLSVRGVPLPPFTDEIFAKKKLRIWGGPPSPPLRTFSQKCSLKSAKNGVFCPQNTCFLVKISYGFGRYPPNGKKFSENGVTDLGGTPLYGKNPQSNI